MCEAYQVVSTDDTNGLPDSQVIAGLVSLFRAFRGSIPDMFRPFPFCPLRVSAPSRLCVKTGRWVLTLRRAKALLGTLHQ